MRRRTRSRALRGLRRSALVALVALAGTACGPLAQLADLPRLKAEDVEPRLVPQTSTILDARGKVITTFHGAENRTVIGIDELRPHTIAAIVAIEDERFFEHDGVDLRAIARAAVENIKSGGVAQGGSTITQQFVKNRILSKDGQDPPDTFKRKVDEAALARQVERRLSKRQILERYLNTVYFGNGAYGIEAAAKTYFDRPAAKLTLAQSALLAAVIKAPEQFDPYDRPKRARSRRDLVLRKLEAHGEITPKRRARVSSRRLGLAREGRDERYAAPYFVDYVKRLLVFHPRFDFLGDTPEERSNRLFTGGLRIYTTLVRRHQKAAERAIDRVLTERRDPHASLVSLDPRSGYIRALVGGRNFFADGRHRRFSKLNLAITGGPELGRARGRPAAPGTGRQAGSAFKPFALTAALSEGVPISRRYTAPPCVTFPKANDGKPWKVCNYGDAGYGRVGLREATYKSINVAFAKLVLDIGPQPVVDTARALGIDLPLAPVNSGALGTNPVNPLSMATAFATLATNGKRPQPIAVKKIVDVTGEVVFKHEVSRQRVVDPAVAYLVTDTLKDVIRKGTGTRARIGRPAAGKTGTAQEYRDAWFVGSVPQLTAAVWVGYPAASIEMKTSCGAQPRSKCRPTRIQVTGGSWPAEIWRNYMTAATKQMPVKDFKRPRRGLERLTIDVRTGCKATDETPNHARQRVRRLEENAPRPSECRVRERATSAEREGQPSSPRTEDRSDTGSQDEREREDEGDLLPDDDGDREPEPEPSQEPEPEPSQEPEPEPSQEPEPEPSQEPEPSPSPSGDSTPGG